MIACYKPPNVDADNFYSDFEALVSIAENRELYILGDLNSDLLQNNYHINQHVFFKAYVNFTN